jgi:small nuclear ribonucleoprotein (snRNP)-like protein
MPIKNLTPYQNKLLKEWKEEEVIVEFTDPEKKDIRGIIRDVDVHQNIFIIENSMEQVILIKGIRCIRKLNLQYVPEIMENHKEADQFVKDYRAIPEA